MDWHSTEQDKLVRRLNASIERGFSTAEAERVLEQHGANAFSKEPGGGAIRTLLGQLKSPLVVILILASVTMFFLGEFVDATVIFIAVIINVGIGVFQEERAGKAFEKLSSSQEQFATVIRDGSKRVIPAHGVVRGDIVILRSGKTVPADTRIISARELQINEAALTGEWLSVDKNVGIIEKELPLAERTNMAWMGTLVVGGTGKGIVVETGDETQIGQIAESLQEVKDVRTPIQKNVRRLARFLAYLVLTIVVAIFVIGLLRGQPVTEMLLLAIAVAVSVIPEGLPAAVTAVLAIGMEKILDRQGLVRNLLAAETLGGTTVILTDKTGTLTKARMSLSEIVTLNNSDIDQQRALGVAVLASDAFIESNETGKEMVVRGRPMEQAIVRAGVKAGLVKKDLAERDALTFNSERRFAASLNKDLDGSSHIEVSGAPELLLEFAKYVLEDGKSVPMTDAYRKHFSEALEASAREGMRVVAVGFSRTQIDRLPEVDSKESREKFLGGLVFAGLLVFSDPVRKDVARAIERVRSAGASVIMLTGDNKETATSIAIQAGILDEGGNVLEGGDIEKLDDTTLIEALKNTRVLARVVPKQKQRIVKLLQKHGEVVAMTGDGVNDAPALRSADIGVAIGSGTEVAREAADLVLLNDSFSIIVAAIEEGRRIIDNLKKSVTHLLSTSFHEVFLIAAAVFFGLPLPVLPVQILWVNILQEGFLSFGFAFEPGERNLMKRNPREESSRNILTKDIKKLIFIAGTITSIFSIALYLVLLALELPLKEVRTIMFVVLLLDSLFFALSLKNLRGPFWRTSLLNNRYLLFALGISILGMLLTLSIPTLRSLLSLAILQPFEILILAGVGLFNLVTIEFSKRVVFRGH